MKELLKKISCLIPDKLYLQIRYYLMFHRTINFDSPITFNEKIQWLKIYDRKEYYTKLVDKYEVRNYIKNTLGEEYLIPMLGVWNSFDEIDFDELPDEFVLKCTHDSGGVIICKNKIELDLNKVKKILSRSMKNNYYYTGREMPYKNVKPKIIAEKYMIDDKSRDLNDYKFYCFNGNPLYCQVISDRHFNETIDFYDMEWQHQEFVGLTKGINNATELHSKPVNFSLMIEFSKILSKNIPFIRIDFYEISSQLFFGEMTFYPASGFGEFTPKIWNYTLGDLIKLGDE